HLGGLLVVDQRADDVLLALGWIANLELGGALNKTLEESVVNPPVDKNFLDRHADLPLVHESTEIGGLRGALHIRVLEDDQRILAAQLDAALLEVRTGLGRDLTAN